MGDRQHADTAGVSGVDERLETGVEGGVAEAVAGVDHDGRAAREGHGGNGVAAHLAARHVVAIGGQVRQSDGADAVGLGIADAARGGTRLQRRRP